MRRQSSLLVGLLLSTAFALADETEQLAHKLQHLKSFEAAFTQQTYRADGELIDASEGQIAIRSGGQFHIQTKQPFPQRLISDGVDFYTYDEELQQVIVQTLVKDINKIPILLFGSDDTSFLENYEVLNIGQTYTLTPTDKNSVFKQLNLAFEGTAPQFVEIIDSLDQTTRIDLSKPSVNQSLEDALFTFVAPQGVDLIDDR